MYVHGLFSIIFCVPYCLLCFGFRMVIVVRCYILVSCRSLRDPLAADDEAPQRVLVPYGGKQKIPDSVSEVSCFYGCSGAARNKKKGGGAIFSIKLRVSRFQSGLSVYIEEQVI